MTLAELKAFVREADEFIARTGMFDNNKEVFAITSNGAVKNIVRGNAFDVNTGGPTLRLR